MDHGGHGGHDHSGHDMPGMDMPTCTMNMLWNTQIVDTCIVFPGWHISSNGAFVLSFFIIIALGIFYEYLRSFSRAVDYRIALSLAKGQKGKHRTSRSRSQSADERSEEAGLISGALKQASTGPGTPVPALPRILRAVLYGATVFLSFFLMLVFMTYNAYLILAVVLGAAAGHYIFGGTINVDALLSDNGKGMACH